jgi:Uma2 family endonuclease
MATPAQQMALAGPLTYADLAEMPDDGYRRELVDGVLLMTPAPNIAHGKCAIKLAALLIDAVVDGMNVHAAPTDWKLSDDTVFEPDVLVAKADQSGQYLTGTPYLVVEVLSPSTKGIDLTLKRWAYERAGVPSYWIVDPVEPAITVLELDDGVYAVRGTWAGDQVMRVERPFPFEAVPAGLLNTGPQPPRS